jgi:penicillin-binding protein 1A
VLVALALAVAAALVALAVVVHRLAAQLPSTAELRNYRPPQVTRVLARDGTTLGELFRERRTLVEFHDIPNAMRVAALAAEDASFSEHGGLNYMGILRALAKDVGSGARARQGGSTITQQVVKNVLLSPERTFDRKIREAILARRIEAELSKDEILEIYLNHIYFGHGRYGVEEAARYYFGKGIREVTLAEAAMLAGIVKGPSVYSPRVDLARATARRNQVVDQMVQKGFLPAYEAAPAKAEPVALAPEPESKPELAPEVVDEARRTLRALVGSAAELGGYTITTTIDPALQTAARAAVRKNADDYSRRRKLVAPLTRSKREPKPFDGQPGSHHAYLGVVVATNDAENTLDVRVGDVLGKVFLADSPRYNPNGLPPSAFSEVGKVIRARFATQPSPTASPEADNAERPAAAATPASPPAPRLRLELGPEGALVALDVRSRDILALVGSYEAVRGGLDRTAAAHRQPGSTFKPFVYSYAIHTRAMTPATIVETSPSALHGYHPDNFDEGDAKTAKRLRDALAQSINVAAVWTLERVGAANVAAWAHLFGIESNLGADLSLALGSYEVTPREMAAAYATFAAGGVYEPPVLIRKIEGPNHTEVPLPDPPAPRRVLDEAEAYIVTSLLTSVVRDGTGKRAKALRRPVAGKTGTSNEAKDAWFVGYTTDIACAVWTGYDDPSPLGPGETGATAALPAFVDFMRDAHRGKPIADFAVPVGVARVMIDPATGARAYPEETDAIEEVFLAGTEPAETAARDAGLEDGAVEGGALEDRGPSTREGDASVHEHLTSPF